MDAKPVGGEGDTPDYKYPYKAGDGRESEEAFGPACSLRGGSFSDDRGVVRCAFHSRGSPHTRGVDYGFRILASPHPPLKSVAEGEQEFGSRKPRKGAKGAKKHCAIVISLQKIS